MTLTECQSIFAGGEYGLLDEMYIRPEFRSHKIGSKLIEKIKQIGKSIAINSLPFPFDSFFDYNIQNPQLLGCTDKNYFNYKPISKIAILRAI